MTRDRRLSLVPVEPRLQDPSVLCNRSSSVKQQQPVIDTCRSFFLTRPVVLSGVTLIHSICQNVVQQVTLSFSASCRVKSLPELVIREPVR